MEYIKKLKIPDFFLFFILIRNLNFKNLPATDYLYLISQYAIKCFF